MTIPSIPERQAKRPFAKKALSAAICAVALSMGNAALAQDTSGSVRGIVQGAGSTL